MKGMDCGELAMEEPDRGESPRRRRRFGNDV